MSFEYMVEIAARTLDIAGILAIAIGTMLATWQFLRAGRRELPTDRYRSYRSGIGRAILLSLEFLVAADIIRTVALEPTFTGVGVLATIVAVRTFLSFTLELELEGQWPWQRGRTQGAGER